MIVFREVSNFATTTSIKKKCAKSLLRIFDIILLSKNIISLPTTSVNTQPFLFQPKPNAHKVQQLYQED